MLWMVAGNVIPSRQVSPKLDRRSKLSVYMRLFDSILLRPKILREIDNAKMRTAQFFLEAEHEFDHESIGAKTIIPYLEMPEDLMDVEGASAFKTQHLILYYQTLPPVTN